MHKKDLPRCELSVFLTRGSTAGASAFQLR